jgi:DNA-binding SARP family transcriptional activator
LATRIQVCGRVTAELDGRRIEAELPGRQGRLVFVYLTVNRLRPVSRDELAAAVWPEDAPAASASGLSALLSKLRRVVPVEGRSELRLRLPPGAWIDLEAAAEGLHRAEAAVARHDWTGAWGPGRVAQHVAARGFLPGEDAPWIDDQRRRLEEIHARALELVGRACLEIGGSELDTAERAARTLVAKAPYRESGHRLLMEALAARGNPAEALVVYERLRGRLREELGAAPGPETQALHRRLLGPA